MKKICTLLLLSLIACTSLSACGENNASVQTTAAVSEETTAAVITEITTTTEAKPSVVDEEVMAAIRHADTYDAVNFGGYKWIVIDKNGSSALLLAKDCVASMPFNDNRKEITWEDSTIRKYLNGQFYESFTPSEKELIVETKVINDENPKNDTYSGRDTTDKIFLLSIDEVMDYFYLEKYFSDYSETIAKYKGEESWWWMRTTGYDSLSISAVRPDGGVHVDGFFPDVEYGIRPAMWVSFGDKSDYETDEMLIPYQSFPDHKCFVTPNSCINDITYITVEEVDFGAKKYYYFLGKSASAAKNNADKYNDMLKKYTDYTIKVHDDDAGTVITDGRNIIGTVTWGTVEGDAYFMTVYIRR